MKRTVLYVLAIFVLIDCIVRYNKSALQIYTTPDVDETDDLHAYRNSSGPADLCFMGPSYAMVGFEDKIFRGQRLFGVQLGSVYNLAVTGGFLSQWVIDRQMKARPPKVVIYGVAPYEFNRKNQFGLVNLVPADFLAANKLDFHPEDFWPWFVSSEFEPFLERTWALYRYRKSIVFFLVDALQERLGSRWHANIFAEVNQRKEIAAGASSGASSKGNSEEIAAANLAKRLKQPEMLINEGWLQDFHFGNTVFLETTIGDLISRGAKVVVVDMPVSDEAQRAYTPEIWSQYTGYLSNLAHSRKILFLVLTRQQCGIDNEDYVDTGHMTPVGGRKFSQCVLRVLESAKFPSTTDI